jgi:hypothetical protein
MAITGRPKGRGDDLVPQSTEDSSMDTLDSLEVTFYCALNPLQDLPSHDQNVAQHPVYNGIVIKAPASPFPITVLSVQMIVLAAFALVQSLVTRQ